MSAVRTGVEVFSTATAQLRVTVADNTIESSSAGVGVLCNSPDCSAPGTVITVISGNTIMTNRSAMLVSGMNATIVASANTIGKATVGLQTVDSVLITLQNKLIEGPAFPTSDTMTTATPH